MNTINEKLMDIGFEVMVDNDQFVAYTRFIPEFNYIQRLDITAFNGSKQLIQSYENGTNNAVGLTAYETKLALEKLEDMLEKQKISSKIRIINCIKSIKLFTHGDLDGIGCIVVLALAYGLDDINYTICNHDDIDKNIKEYLQSGDNHSLVYITDISPSEEVAKIIDESINNDDINVTLLDHHKTKLWYNDKYHAWSKVSVTQDDSVENAELTSGTEMLYQYLIDKGELVPNKAIETFVSYVKRYDTWLWKNDYRDGQEGNLNQLLSLMGNEEFIDNMIYKLSNNLPLFDKNNLSELKHAERIKNDYIEKMMEKINVIEVGGYKIGLNFNARYNSELGNTFCMNREDVDLYMDIDLNYGTVSMRSTKPNIDVAEIATKFGGGGHKAAAGFTLDDRVVPLFLDTAKLYLMTHLVPNT